MVSVCVLCMVTSEATPHLFLHCSLAVALWNWLAEQFQIVFNMDGMQDIFQSCNPAWCSQVKDLALAAIIHTFHTIWMTRNKIRFNNAKVSIHSAKIKIGTLIAASSAMTKSFASSATVDLQVLSNIQVPVQQRPKKKSLLVLWKAPPIFWTKVNTDGSFTQTSSACGGIFRNHHANYLGSFASCIYHSSVLYTESMEIVLVMEEAAARGWWNIWLESDSKTALGAFTNFDIVPWDL
ncbi:ribonuclease H [Trifolium pratense]|uniref:Ribonuclease H n=1 Tax=Trifolium pratense TaxID=57577 RepID=A0A2K3NR25_TRIPR|nr:ribonuclease H [Trifolium pratense]